VLDSGSTPLVFLVVTLPVSGDEDAGFAAVSAGAGAGSEPPQPERTKRNTDAQRNSNEEFRMVSLFDLDKWKW